MTNDAYSGQDRPPFQVEPEPALIGHPGPSAPGAAAQPGPYGPYPPQNGQLYLPPVQANAPAPSWAPVPRADPMPDGPRDYQQMLRGPRRRWWRPLLALVLATVIASPLMLLAYLPVVLAALIAGVPDPVRWAAREIVKVNDLGPAGFFYVNLTLIVLIPTAGLSIWVAHRIRPRYLSSVQGGLRWRWLLRCVAVVVPVWVLYLGASALLDPTRGARPAHWGLLLVMVVFLTPLQAAGEEYFFRGWILQNVGAWFPNPRVGLVVGLAVSVTTFSAAHGSPDIWVLGSLGIFALTAGLATWRTGGLEAGIAIHAVNNISVFFGVILLGGWQQAFVSASSKSTPVVFGVDVVVHAIALTLILWQAKRCGIQRRYQPDPTQTQPELAPAPLPAVTT